MLTRVGWVVVPWVAACGFEPGALGLRDDSGTTMTDDAPVRMDARVDTPPGQICVGTGLFTECFDPQNVPTGEYNPTNTNPIDTDTTCDSVIPQNGGPSLCVKRAGTILITRTIRYEGSRPIVLLATETIQITSSGVLDVSLNPDIPGAGCTGTNGGDDTSSSANAGAGGGGGGGFGTGGGGGGAGEGAGGGGGGGGAIPATVIRAGCNGFRGGASSDGNGGAGGDGGGAIYLVAGTSISIAGDIRANGGGGQGGRNKAGGGGGGSGGYIGLDAPTVTMTSTGELVANGGAGGEGGGGGQPGGDGEDATAYDARPDGGLGNNSGSNGGDGAFETTNATNGGNNNGGGGGGGGGHGRIGVFATTTMLGTRVSPPVP